MFSADFVFDLGGTAGSGGPAVSVFHVQFLSKIFARVRGRRPNLIDDLKVGSRGESWRAAGHGSKLHTADGEGHQIGEAGIGAFRGQEWKHAGHDQRVFCGRGDGDFPHGVEGRFLRPVRELKLEVIFTGRERERPLIPKHSVFDRVEAFLGHGIRE